LLFGIITTINFIITKKTDKMQEKLLTQTPAANVVDEYGEHKNAHDVEYDEHNPEDLVALGLQ